MAVFAFVQVFLTSMILGVVIGDLKIGSSPFILMRDFMPDTPVFAMDPNFVPADGTGLNPLLQNFYMAIHPPSLYTGFVAMTIPYAFAMAALITGHLDDAWLRAVLDHFGLHRAALVGLSMGGESALDFALAHPERVRSMILANTGAPGAPWIATWSGRQRS